MSVTQVEKRDKSIVSFNQTKIWKAISKAFLDVKSNFSLEEAEEVDELVESVVLELNQKFVGITPNVENIQDIVERKLMEKGFYDVAKGYILYRSEKSKERVEKELKQKNLHPTLTVKKSSGQIVPLNIESIRQSFVYASEGYEDDIDIDNLVDATLNSVYTEIATRDLSRLLVMVARTYIEKDPAYSYLAARLLLNVLYKEVIGGKIDYSKIDTLYKRSFSKNIQDAVKLGLLDERLLEYNLEWIASHLKPERDKIFKFLGMQTLYDRYFITDPVSKRIFETPQAFWMRVALGLALAELPEKREQKALEFYEVISTLNFIPSTPTLFHSGTNHPQLSSCYLNTVEDDLAHIFKVMGDNAQMSKWSGGIGTDWTNLRATGALIKGTGVESQGITPFLKVANDTTAAINRSGKRRGAAVVYLETWHLDIDDFLELRKNTGDERRRTHDMDTANWIPDLFMQRVQADQDWTLFSPDEVLELHHIYGKEFKEKYEYYEEQARLGKIKMYKTVKAKDLWRKMITMLFETGHPWITFKDPCNLRSPQDHVGVIHNSNLCTEITLNNSDEETAVCNLGSLNLSNYVQNGKFDAELVAKVVPVAVRMLDNVVDINFYPTKEGEVSNKRHRPIGLGIMGFHDALYKLDINFDPEKAVEFSDESMEIIAYHTILASSKLAQEKGKYESYKGSKWDRGLLPVDTIALIEDSRDTKIDMDISAKLDWDIVRKSIKKYGMRNSNTMAIAPTATISNIAGSIPAIEPIYKNLYVKANQGGDFIIINDYLVEDLKKENLWNQEMFEQLKFYDGSIAQIPEVPVYLKEKYKEVFDIDSRWLIKIAAYRGKWIDQSQSLNIFYKGTSGKEIADIYMYAWEMGLKTTYYLRSLAVSQVEKSTVNTAQFGKTHKRDNGSNGVTKPTEPVVTVEPKEKVKVEQPKPVEVIKEESKPKNIKLGTDYKPKYNIYAVAEGQICESCQ